MNSLENMETIVEDTVTVIDSEEATLHCSIWEYQLYEWRIEHASVRERVHMMEMDTKSTLQQFNDWVNDCHVVAVKK